MATGQEIEIKSDNDAPVEKMQTFLPWLILVVTIALVWAVFTIVDQGFSTVPDIVAVAAGLLAAVLTVSAFALAIGRRKVLPSP